MNKFLKQLMMLFFPHKCFLCGTVLEGDGWICKNCQFPYTKNKLCNRCGKEKNHCICNDISMSDGIELFAPLFYTDAVAFGIHRYKYHGCRYLASYLGDFLTQHIETRYDISQIDVITYVPMFSKKLKQRGFSQTKLLAKQISKNLQIPIAENYLSNTGKGKTQMTQKGLKNREENVKYAFDLLPDCTVTGKTVLLIDDILTTGATMRRCAELLIKAGAEKVYGVAIATTDFKQKQCLQSFVR